MERARYRSLFSLNREDYRAWAHGLKAAGYATNPQYAQLLIKIIEENNLQRYDRLEGGVSAASGGNSEKASLQKSKKRLEKSIKKCERKLKRAK